MKISMCDNLLRIDNYKHFLDASSDLIVFEDIKIAGTNMFIKYIDKDMICISGKFKVISLGERIDEIQNNNEKK